MNDFLCWLLLFSAAVVVGCDSTSSLDPIGTPTPADSTGVPPDDNPGFPVEPVGTIAFTATTMDGAQKIYVAPFDSPVNSEAVSPPDGYFRGVALSPTGTKLLSISNGNTQYTGQAYLTDLSAAVSTPLNSNDAPVRPAPGSLIWETDESGFFYSVSSSISGLPSVWKYSFDVGVSVRLNDRSFMVTSLVGNDTLIASNFDTPDSFVRPVFLSTQGDVLATLVVAELEATQGTTGGGLLDFEWNPARKLFAFEVWESSFSRNGIAVCDRDGHNVQWVVRPDNQYQYRWPEWGPNGQLLFLRLPKSDVDGLEGQVYLFSMDDGTTRQYLTASDIPNGKGISRIDWNGSPD